MANKLTLRIKALVSGAKDVLGLSKNVDKLGKESTETAKETEQLNRSLNENEGATKRSGAAMVKTAALFAAVALAASKAAGAVKEWISASNIQERAERKLALSLKNLVGATDEQVQALKDQASALQELTGYGDEQTISAQAMLATFQLTADEIKQLTPRLLDMAEAARKAGQEQVDLEQISIALGKAFVDGLGSLKRYGVAMTEAQEEAFKLADQSEKVRIITEALDGNFAGLAAEIGGSYEGALRKATAAHGDLHEVIGKQVTNNKHVVDATVSIKEAYKEMAAGISASSEEIQGAVSFMARTVKAALGTIQAAWNGLQITIKTTVLAINEGINLINKGMAKVTFGDVSAQWQQAVDELTAANDELRASIAEDVDDISNGFGKIVSAIDGTKTATEKLGGSFTELAKQGRIVEGVFSAVGRGVDYVKQKASQLSGAFATSSASAGIAAAKYLTLIQNAKTVGDVSVATSDAVRALGNNTEALAFVSEAAAKKVAEFSGAQEGLKSITVDVTESLSENYGEMLRLSALYREGAISLEEFSAGNSTLISKNIELRESQRALNDATRDTTSKQTELGDATEKLAEKMASFINLTAIVRNRYYELSEAVGRFFDKTMAGVSSIKGWWDALSDRRFEQVKRQYDILVNANNTLIQRLRDGTATAQDMASAQSALAFNVNAAAHGMIALGAQELGQLRAALADAQSRLESLRDSAESTLTSLQNELDRLSGNLTAIEQRNYEQKRLQLLEQLNQAQAAGDAAAIAALQKSLELLERIYNIKIANLEADQQSARAQSGGTSSRFGGRSGSGGSGGGTGGDSGGGSVSVGGNVVTEINLDGKQIARVVQPYFSEFERLSG